MAKQVFHDPQQARWKRLRPILDAVAIGLSLLLVFFLYTAIRSEPLPALSLADLKRPYRALKESEKEKARERRAKLAKRGHRKSKTAPSQVKLNAEEGIRAAFYVAWDAASFASLREYSHQIDLLYPEWLHVLTADGRIQSVDQNTNTFFDVMDGQSVRTVDDKVMPFLSAEDANMEVFPMVNNFDGINWVDVSAFLNSPQARERFRHEVARFLAGSNMIFI